MSLLLLLAIQNQPQTTTPAASPTPRPLPNGPVVSLETSFGTIKIGLDKEKAPITVDNFIKYVRAGHYDGTIFHRVIPDFMIQGGGFEEDMTERPTRPAIRNEGNNGLRNLRGTVAMARTNAPDSATAQFFINLRDNPSLDYGIRGAGYAVFGEVIEGMDVVEKIVGVTTTTKGMFQDVPVIPVMIKRAREVGGAAPAATSPAAAKPASPKPAASAKPTPKPTPKP
jgi:peptidyl-prolyl cis-trans isomerase A (cyclophilin A)